MINESPMLQSAVCLIDAVIDSYTHQQMYHLIAHQETQHLPQWIFVLIAQIVDFVYHSTQQKEYNTINRP